MEEKLTIDKQGLYDRLLFDEEFQTLRLEALGALPAAKAGLLGTNDQQLIAGVKVPEWIGAMVSRNYAEQLSVISKKRPIIFFNRLHTFFKECIQEHPNFSGGGVVTAGIILGIWVVNSSPIVQNMNSNYSTASYLSRHQLDFFNPNTLDLSSKNTSLSFSERAKKHMYGIGVPQNYDKALSLYQLAAEEGSVMAQSKINTIYSHRYNLETDKNSNIWFQGIKQNSFVAGAITQL